MPTFKPFHMLRRTLLTQAALVVVTALAVLSPVQAQDAAGVLNMFQQLTRPNQPVQPLPVAPAGQAGNPLANLLGGATGNAIPGLAQGNNAAAANQANELLGLLSQSVEQIDQPKEIEIGRQLAAVLLGSKPLYPDMAMQRYVNRLGRWISLQSARPDLPWTFAVLDDGGFNAFAAPGGYIFVTKGLIDRVADESELAGILAHEITHVVEKHHLKAISKNARAGILTKIIGSQLSNNLGPGLSSQFMAIGKDIYSKGLDQGDEFEADRAGVALAARAGFDPYGLLAVLQTLRTASPNDGAFTLTMSTHPPAQARLDQIELAMGNRLDTLSGKTSLTVPQRLERMALADRRSTPSAAPSKAAAPTKPAAKPAPKAKAS